MEINFYDKADTKIKPLSETVSVPLNILIADKVNYHSVTADLLATYIEIDQLTPGMIAYAMETSWPDSEHTLQLAEDVRNAERMIKLMNALKHKDKNALLTIGANKSFISEIRGRLKLQCEEFIFKFHLFEILPFVQDKIIELKKIMFDDKQNKNLLFANAISSCLQNRQNILCLSQEIEELLRFTTPSNKNYTEADFVKFPLCNFPPIVGLNYNQIKYIRDNLKPSLLDFKTGLEEFSDMLKHMPYSVYGHEQIEMLFNDKLSVPCDTLRRSIDESLYLTQVKNKFPSNVSIILNLGIASAQTIISFYEKAEILLPDMALMIKDQVSRLNDFDCCYPFIYYEIKAPLQHGEPIDGFSQLMQ
jgi:hypothetical protein